VKGGDMTREQAIKEFESELEWAKLNIYPYVSKQKIEADKMAIKALELVEYIEQRYEEECNERRKQYADGWYHSLSMCDGASYALGQVLDKWKESAEDK
jgi:hypothetical protein